MDTQDISRREKLRGLYKVATFRPVLTAAIVAASVVTALLEGIGISFIIPIVEIVQQPGDPTADASGEVAVFVAIYDTLGIPFSLGTVVLGVIAIMAVRFATTFLVEWLRIALQTRYVRHLQTDAFGSALRAEVSYFDEEGSDDILNAIVTQAEIAGKVIRDVIKFVKELLLCGVYLGIALYLAPRLTLAAGVMLGGLTLFVRKIVEPGYTIGDRVADANEEIQRSVQAGTQGIRDVKLFTLTDELFDRFSTHIDTYTRSSIKLGRNEALIDNVYNFAAASMVFGLIYVAIGFTGLSLAALGMFLFAMFQLAPRLSQANNYFYRVEGTFPHLIRTQNFIGELRRREEPAGGDRPVPESPFPISFDDVSFAYDDEPVLRNVSFRIDSNEFVAFVGPSGAGKSTIAVLLARLYDPDGGGITVAGRPLSAYDVTDWRSRVAVVRQNPFLFNDTLRHNVTVGNRDASQREIERACEIAHVTEFLDDLPKGYDTELGDDGVRLSGGQRQRVALARALLKDADVLILDEATSDLDSGIEDRVHTAIEEMDRDYAILAIAHRLSTVRGADRIHTVEDGRIVERGDHGELLDEGGRYADLYAMQ
ncbi:ABC transporter ATP-binding protein [Natronococcus sp. JC468]|uniref:ABC transporter ATP-binding protein n=1 Tax=Natronococcus sp. JC468 TaxID=1961921 RepID=UPI00143C4CBD|nr:ABC transporter ATP-binding protein [Natronococcus sp. JC468]NKE34918.1 ABC transporter ATP-binding protein [Natronococcus sp. JC468]